jgi:AcrR family transcriptional regulator
MIQVVATRIAIARISKGKARLEPRRVPVQRRSRETVDAVLIAAAQVFETHGYTGGTTNRIAQVAGVSIGTLYQYFPSKEALAVALLERHIEETQRQMREWVGHMVAERHTLHGALEDYIGGMLNVHVLRPRLQHILLEETPLPEHVHLLLLEAEHQLARTMAGLLRTYAEVQHPQLKHAAYVAIHTIEALTHRFAAHPEDPVLSQEDLKKELVRLLEGYLQQPQL